MNLCEPELKIYENLRKLTKYFLNDTFDIILQCL